MPEIEPGIFVDVFMLESTYSGRMLRAVHGCGSLLLGFLYSCRKHFSERDLLRRWRMDSFGFRVKRLLGAFLAFLPIGFWTRLWDFWNSFCGNRQSEYVTFPVGRRHFFGELAMRTEMQGSREADFEGRKVRIPMGTEDYMKRLYGADYMTLPPEDRREKHSVFPPFSVAAKPAGV